MTDDRRPGEATDLTCDEVRDLAASFVLGALHADEARAVRAHLATCPNPHPEMTELGGVLPALDASVPLVEPPAGLKGRIMAAAAADLAARQATGATTTAASPIGAVAPGRPATPSTVAPAPIPFPTAGVRRPSTPLRWALGIAAVLAIVLLGGQTLQLQSQLRDAQAYERQVAAVLDAANRPGALTAVLRSTEAGGPSGFAAVTRDGVARFAMRDLAPTTGTQVYEAWVIVGSNAPVALGGFQVGVSGVGYLEADGLPTDSGIVLAFTREPAPGATAPSSDPVSVGTATAAS
jgi:anti-sigma-K factor RskA